MRVLQVIDSLEPGGAERMALNYAIALKHATGFAALAVTRKEGSLRNAIPQDVPYCFLNRKATFDIKAIMALRNFCKQHKIEWLHAHSTSWFICICVKLLAPKLKIIWHDHYGLSEFADDRKPGALKWASMLFFGIITVNQHLREWSEVHLKCNTVVYFPNFSLKSSNEVAQTTLKGEAGKRILCLANLRPQKDHFMLIRAALQIEPGWTFHLVGKDFRDDYSKEVRQTIISKGLENKIFVYGSCNDVQNIITQSDICILTSASEGLPVALLEYGFMAKAVVATAVGEVGSVINNGENGLTCEPGDATGFAAAVKMLISDETKRIKLGGALEKTVHETYSQQAVMTKYTNWINRL